MTESPIPTELHPEIWNLICGSDTLSHEIDQRISSYEKPASSTLGGTAGFILDCTDSIQRSLIWKLLPTLLSNVSSTSYTSSVIRLCCSQLILHSSGDAEMILFNESLQIWNELSLKYGTDHKIWFILDHFEVFLSSTSSSSSSSSSLSSTLQMICDLAINHPNKPQILALSECSFSNSKEFLPMGSQSTEDSVGNTQMSSWPSGIIQSYRLGLPIKLPVWESINYEKFMKRLCDMSGMDSNDVLKNDRIEELTFGSAISVIRNVCSGMNSSSSMTSSSRLNLNSTLPSSIEIFGLEEQREQLLEWIGLTESSKTLPLELYPTGIVIYGGSGFGKTLLADWLSQKASGRFSVSHFHCADLLNKIVGHSEKLIADTFRRAQARAPSIVFMDNLDIIFGESEDRTGSSAMGRSLAALLNALDECARYTASGKPVIVVATVTSLRALDKALIRSGRLESHLQLLPPNSYTRSLFMEELLLKMVKVDSISDESRSAIQRLCCYIEPTKSLGDVRSLSQEAALALLQLRATNPDEVPQEGTETITWLINYISQQVSPKQ